MTKSVEKFWNLTANNYDKIESQLELIYNKIFSNLLRQVKQDDIVLDFACGTGTASILISERVKKIEAIDISGKMLKNARLKAKEKGFKNIDFIQTDIYDKRFDKESYDIILAIGILHLLTDNQETVTRIKELLKPGGLFISSTPCLAEKMIFSYKLKFLPAYFISKLRLLPQILRRYTSADLEKLITSADFQLIESEKIFDKMTAYFAVSKKE